jgi:hypothetical protein
MLPISELHCMFIENFGEFFNWNFVFISRFSIPLSMTCKSETFLFFRTFCSCKLTVNGLGEGIQSHNNVMNMSLYARLFLTSVCPAVHDLRSRFFYIPEVVTSPLSVHCVYVYVCVCVWCMCVCGCVCVCVVCVWCVCVVCVCVWCVCGVCGAE